LSMIDILGVLFTSKIRYVIIYTESKIT